MRATLAGILLGLAVSMVAFWAGAEETDATPGSGDAAGPAGCLDIVLSGKTMLRTMAAPFDPERAEDTYKVYTHVFAPVSGILLTKGPGGLYPHHRGMFVGWNDTLVPSGKGDPTDYDTWHMSNCLQQLSGPAQEAPGSSGQILLIDWSDRDGTPFVREQRTVAAALQDERLVVDFTSVLTSLHGTVQLRGDLQHAGMQIRLADEVSKHEASTEYTLPETAETRENDEVVGAWWACCSAEIEGSRHWVLHMTAPDHPTGVPVYSIREYGRFGAFSEHDIVEGVPLTLAFRIVASEGPLDRAACQALYDAYAAERSATK